VLFPPSFCPLYSSTVKKRRSYHFSSVTQLFFFQSSSTLCVIWSPPSFFFLPNPSGSERKDFPFSPLPPFLTGVVQRPFPPGVVLVILLRPLAPPVIPRSFSDFTVKTEHVSQSLRFSSFCFRRLAIPPSSNLGFSLWLHTCFLKLRRPFFSPNIFSFRSSPVDASLYPPYLPPLRDRSDVEDADPASSFSLVLLPLFLELFGPLIHVVPELPMRPFLMTALRGWRRTGDLPCCWPGRLLARFSPSFDPSS